MAHIGAARIRSAGFVLAAVVAACSSGPSSSAAPGPAVSLLVTGLPSSAAVGNPETLLLTAKDASGNTAIGYTGTVHVTTTDSVAQIPPNYTFAIADAGTHKFAVTFHTT